jgi:polyphosphate kinase
VPGLSENIRVRSVVGQFLEHSRIFRFGGADTPTPDLDDLVDGPPGSRDGDPGPGGIAVPGIGDRVNGAADRAEASLPLQLIIGSADLMERNLDRRIEVLVPVRDPELQARLLEILGLIFADDTNTWALRPNGRWVRVPARRGISAQRRLKELAIDRARRRREPEPRPVEAVAPASEGVAVQ